MNRPIALTLAPTMYGYAEAEQKIHFLKEIREMENMGKGDRKRGREYAEEKLNIPKKRTREEHKMRDGS